MKTVLTIIVTTIIVSGASYFYFNNNKTTSTNNTPSNSNSSLSQTAKTFCQDNSTGMVVDSILYLESTENGNFVKCTIRDTDPESMGGYQLTGKNINNTWTEIFSGQDVMSEDIITQYKVPSEISGSTIVP
ncbi:MAG: hypothetical protein WCW17_04385 [Patescibacteria group bacterium]|jgi:hypothetical protein